MPFYLRKSVKAGPFRFNLSKSGVGASVGVKGLRIGTGPRGHYVHAGRGGFYYRATLGGAGGRSPRNVVEPAFDANVPTGNPEGGVEFIEIDTGDVLALRDEAFAEVLDEINSKRKQFGMATILSVPVGLIGLFALLAGGSSALPVLLACPIGWSFGRWLDSYRKVCVLFYEMEPEVKRDYEHAVEAFDGMMSSEMKWHIEAGGAVQDLTTWKRNAGASHIVKKKPTTLAYKLPPTVKSNLTPPAIHVGKQVLYFFPDIAIIDDGRTVGAAGYHDLALVSQASNFIEEGRVPKDAEVIGQTWKYPNKSGGPDRRFRDNRQIPVCRYETMHMKSAKGVNEIVEFSKVGVVAPFAQALKGLPRNTGEAQLPHGGRLGR